VDIAYDATLKNKINASSAKHGIYFCIECKDYAYLVSPKNKAPYFRHFRYNENCSLSVKSDSGYFNINNMIKVLMENYKERWIEAINSLIKHNSLYVMENKEWALEPLNYYISKFYDSLDKGIYFQLLILIISIDDEKSDRLLYKFLDSNNLDESDKIFLIKKSLNNTRPITKEFFDLLVAGVNIDRDTLFKVIYNKLGIIEYNKLVKQTKYVNLICISRLLKLYTKWKDENKIYLEYLNIKEQYYKNWNEEERLYFLNKLMREFTLINKNSDMLKLFEKDLIELKYYV
jgi:hypothetical protein